jgi:hypothetical protein
MKSISFVKELLIFYLTNDIRGKAVAIWERGRPAVNLGEPARAANKFDQCNDTQKNAIEAAFQDARIVVTRAASVLGSAYGKPSSMTDRTRLLLNTHFRTTDRGNILKIFRNLFRIDQALQKGLKFKCETNCQSRPVRQCGYTWATQWFGGKGDIHICFDTRPGHCSFLDISNPQKRAAAIIHEAAHRHVGIGDKAYVWERIPLDPRDYSKLTSKQAMDNADSYAWFCVDLNHDHFPPKGDFPLPPRNRAFALAGSAQLFGQ